MKHAFYEFFAGGGMARAGLGPEWRCLFANDFDHKKSVTYKRNWGGEELFTGDVRSVRSECLPGSPQMIWGSFPCQDLSLAGAGAGLKGDRSGTFWPFWDVVKGLIAEGRAPLIIALENVVGTLHSHSGKDFTAICSAMNRAGYRFGAMVIDAALFVPQSRPRLFVVGVRENAIIPGSILGGSPSSQWHPRSLQQAHDRLPGELKKKWLWWDMPTPPTRTSVFADLVEDKPAGVQWHTPDETKRLLSMMSDVNLAKVDAAKKLARDTGKRQVGTIYRRTRRDENGCKVQRAEIRFDNVAGCLRTPAGGSSRQLIMVVDGKSVRSRLISSRETARLMGLPDDYILPDSYNEAYHLTGDGVVVPAVNHLANSILKPLIATNQNKRNEAA